MPDDLVVIAGKAMEKDPDRRYATMKDLAADLRRFLGNEPIVARPPSVWNRLVKWTKRNPTKSVAGAVAGGLLGGAPLLRAPRERSWEGGCKCRWKTHFTCDSQVSLCTE